MKENLKYKKVLVTGAAGFIGHATCKRLLKEGYTVIGLDNINDYYDVNLKYARLKDMGVDRLGAAQWNKMVVSETDEKLRFVRMNLEDRESMPKLFEQEQFDAVIHLAAQAGVRYSLENPETYIDSNIVGFLNILECCRHNKVKHLVYASSSSVYGANEKVPFEEHDRVDYPVSLYAATKKSNELMAYTYSHLYQIATSGLRFFTVYGPWGRPDMAPMLFANAITERKPIKVFNHGDMLRDFTYIDDIVQGILITLNNPPIASEREREGERERLDKMGRESEGASERSKELKTTKHISSSITSHKITENNSSTQQITHSPRRQVVPSQIFNIGNGSPVNLMEFIETMEAILNQKADKNMMDMQAGDVPRTWADTTQLNALGYESTTDIKKGVESFVKWFKEYKNC